MANLGLITNFCYEKKKSKNELSEFLGITPATLSKIQRTNDCTISQIEAIAKFFDIDVKEFFLFPCSDSTAEQFKERFNLFFNDIKQRQICNSILSFASYLDYYNPDNSLISKYLNGKIDIPEKTIGMALAHANTTITSGYISFDHKKIDEANRKVIDYLNE